MAVQLRSAVATDVTAIAALHADSWRRHYRGSYRDEFLDGDVGADRLAVWTERFASLDDTTITVVAEHADTGALAGFAHTILDDDPTWGALLDNLHVAADHQRGGLGTKLLAETARRLLATDASASLYLWVLERNVDAQAFYLARGGRFEDRKTSEPPGGGTIVGIRCVWPDPSVLLEHRSD